MPNSPYRGRLAPTPTGYLHLGHARTFLIAQERAERFKGTLVLRIEDIDQARCRPKFVKAIYTDMAWVGLEWQEGPDKGGNFGPYEQGLRMELFREAWRKLKKLGAIYPCGCSRKDVADAATAPHEENREPIYPGTCRHKELSFASEEEAMAVNWRFRVPDGEKIGFRDANLGYREYRAGVEFGDFLVWRKNGGPSYELAVVVDDIHMSITEVVRGEDLLLSTSRQILLYGMLGSEPPVFYHCPLVRDGKGDRLAKRSQSLSLLEMKARGIPPERIRHAPVDELV